jgi:hypothetical protein
MIPPIAPLGVLLALFSWDSCGYLFGFMNAQLCLSRSVLYGALIAFSYIRYKTVLRKLQIEVDGFLIRNGTSKEEPLKRSASKDAKGADGASLDPAVTWPPLDALGWTPYKSVPFMKIKPKGPGHYWSKAPYSGFQVRSVGYKQSKLKEPSQSPLYECLGVDLVKSNKLVSGLTSNSAAFKRILNGESPGETPWPWLQYKGSKWGKELGIPRLIVINAQLPYSSPSLWAPQSADSDPGFSILSYYAISPSLAENLTSGKVEPPAVKLLRRLIAEGQSKKEGTALKVIGMVDNMDEIGFPDIVAGYNGKPVLVTKSCQLKFWPSQEECEVLEIEYDVRQWSIVARKTLHALRDKFKDAKCQLGMVIEGQTDDELPEQLLGCFRLNFLDILEAVQIEI